MKKILSIILVNFLVLGGLGAIASPTHNILTISTPSTIDTIQPLHGANINWAGYAVETDLSAPQNNAITDIKGSWIVPAVSGTSNAYSGSWIGIDGYSSRTVEQIGTDSNVINGEAVYAAWYEMFPRPAVYLNMAINAGDTISAEVNYLGMGMFRLSLTDVTTGESFSTIEILSDDPVELPSNREISGGAEHVFVGNTQQLALTGLTTKTTGFDIYHNVQFTTSTPMSVSPEGGLFGLPRRSSAEWIIEAPSGLNGEILPLANFGTAYFFNSQVTINGVTGSIDDSHWQNDAVIMQTSTSPPIIKAQPSSLSDNGTSFFVTWQHQ